MKLVRVVPPVDPVVEVQRVPGHIDQERQDEQDVERERVLPAAAPPEPPHHRHDQRRQRVRERPPRHRLALELRQVGPRDREQRQAD
jgi:hypothetical protein